MDLRELIMARPSSSSPDGKRDFEVKVHLTEAEYEDVVCIARAMNKSKSELFRDLLHLQAYGLLGVRSSLDVDGDARGGIVPPGLPR